MRGRGRRREKHYLVRWKGYGPEFDEWILASELEHAADIVQQFEGREEDMLHFIIR